MSDGNGIIGIITEELKDTGKQMGQTVLSVPKDLAKGAAEQIVGSSISPEQQAHDEANKAQIRAALQAQINQQVISQKEHNGPEIPGAINDNETIKPSSGPKVVDIALERAKRKTELGRGRE